MPEVLSMSQKERITYQVIGQLDRGQITAPEAAHTLGISSRHVWRLRTRYRSRGDAAFVHQARGRPSNRAFAPAVRAHVLELFQHRYADYGPTLLSERLFEQHGYTIDPETLRRWLLAATLWTRARKGRRHRRRRPRRTELGRMVQIDGSHHAWFEDRGPTCCLFVIIDDASNRSYFRFAPEESAREALLTLRAYVERYGAPHQVYCDRHSVYWNDRRPTDFARTVERLGGTMIYAHSPQAKGRVERANRTHQDRLVKALREENITTIDQANRFLDSTYLTVHNARFAHTTPVLDVHRSIAHQDLNGIFCFEDTRCVKNDMTFQYQSQFYQILPTHGLRPVPRQEVVIRHWLDGSMHVLWRSEELKVLPIEERPKAAPSRGGYPKPTHPWNGRKVGRAQ